MKLSFILLFAGIIQLFAIPVTGQNATIRLQTGKSTMGKFIDEVETQTKYFVVFSSSEINPRSEIDITSNSGSVSDYLNHILKGTDIHYEFEKDYIILTKRPVENAVAQGITVTGVVTDAEGEPMPGVNVIVKGTITGQVTDANGKYSVNVPNKDAVLVFSFIGYTSQEIKVGDHVQLNITLGEDTKEIEEVVVVGYGVQKKITLTGSVVTAKGSDIVKSPAVNVAQSLAGRLPGVIINTRSGEPGNDDPSLFIRGRGTTGNNSALVLIDGVERNELGRLDPNDIESISVLKDASAAIYGARAANGVILVTTKRGSTGKPTISFSYNQGFSQPTRKPDMADSYTFGKVYNEIEVAEGRAPHYTDAELQKFKDGTDPDYPNTDWYDFIIKKFTPQNLANLSVTGGSERVTYYLSLGEVTQNGMYYEGSSKFNRYNFRSNIDVKITDNLKVGMNLFGKYEDRHFPANGMNNLNSHIFLYQPDWTPYWPGTGYMKPNRDNENILNWVSDNAGYRDENVRAQYSTLSFKWDVPWVEGLSIDGNGSYDVQNMFSKTFNTPDYVYYKDEITGEYTRGRSGFGPNLANLTDKETASSVLYFTVKANYERKFDLHNVGAMIGYEQSQSKGNTLTGSRSDFLSTVLPQLDAGSSDKNMQGNGGNASQGARQNFFGRLSYDYASKYMAQFTLRRDASPNFPSTRRVGWFPSVSAGWRISEEAFMKSVSFINNLKIRGSYGVMGNDMVNPFQYMITYGYGDAYVIGGTDVSGLVQTTVPNPNITWETAKTWNVGLDASLWNGLLGVEFDIFKTRRSDVLTKRNAVIPSYTGLTLPDENIGIVDNKGFELVLTHDNRKHEVKYSLSGNVSFARNKIVFCDEQPAAEPYQLATGRPIDSPLLYNALGIFADQGAVDKYPHLPGAKPGDIIYEDVNDDKVIDSRDMIRINQTNIPEIVFGLSAYVEYKSFDLTVLFQGQENAQQGFGAISGGWFPAMTYSFGNFLQWRADDRWSPENTNATMPRADLSATGNNNANPSYNSTQWMLNAGFLRLKNLELGYNLPKHLCERIKLQSLRLSVSGNNLFIIYDHMKKLGFDPEAPEFWYYQQQRILNIGINLTF